jgi:hypothetical protein
VPRVPWQEGSRAVRRVWYDGAMCRPQIVHAMIAAGWGHVASARAMGEAAELASPGVLDLEVSGSMPDLGQARLDACEQRTIDPIPAARIGLLPLDELGQGFA